MSVSYVFLLLKNKYVFTLSQTLYDTWYQQAIPMLLKKHPDKNNHWFYVIIPMW